MNALPPLGLALIMLTVGLKLTIGDFTRLLVTPRAVIGGVVAQTLLLPILAALIMALVPLPPVMTAGFVILAVCPGGITSNLLTLLAGGDVALALSVTAISTAISTVTLPLVAGLAATWLSFGDAGAPIPFGPTFGAVFAMTAVPVAIGMAWMVKAPATARRAERVIRPLAIVAFAAIAIATFVKEYDTFIAHAATVGPAVVALNIAALAVAAGLARALRLDRPQRVAITMECGLQNAAIAIVIANTVMDDATLAVPAVIYAAVMNVSALSLVAWARVRPSKQQSAQA